MNQSPSVISIFTALAAAQGEFPPIHKDKTAKIQSKTGASFSYLYADLATILEAITPALSKNGLAVMQSVEVDGPRVAVTTRLCHKSGEWLDSGQLVMQSVGTDSKAVAGIVTYARRYSLSAFLGIAPGDEDQDGEPVKGGRSQARTEAARRPARATPAAEAAPEPGADQAPAPGAAQQLPKAATPRYVFDLWTRIVGDCQGDTGKAKVEIDRAIAQHFGTDVPPKSEWTEEDVELLYRLAIDVAF